MKPQSAGLKHESERVKHKLEGVKHKLESLRHGSARLKHAARANFGRAAPLFKARRRGRRLRELIVRALAVG